MSVAETRAAIVAALNSVPGLSATGFTPAPILPGSAWVVLRSAAPFNFCIDLADWVVFVGVSAANSQASVDYSDALIDPVLAALKPLAKVTEVEPWSWPVETGQAAIPVLRFTLEA